MPTAMKLAKSRAMPVLRRKQGRKWLVVSVAVAGFLAVGLAGLFLFYPRSVAFTPEEAELFELMNQTRRNNKIDALEPNGSLCAMARRYSEWMCEHQTTQPPTVEQIQEQLTSVGYPFEKWGLLIDRVHNRGPKWAYVSWMLNEQNRGELKSIHHEEVGISVVHDPKQPDVWYVTVVFAKKTKS